LRVLAETEGLTFFDFDAATGVSHELEGTADLFKHRLTELGHDIAFVLRAMRKGRTVFLGTASSASHDQRQRVRQELNGRGYNVLTTAEPSVDDAQVSTRAAIRESALCVLFYDRAAIPGDPAEATAVLERRIAMDEQASQVVVVHQAPDSTLQPWDEPAATGRGSAKIEWLIEPQTHTLYHTVLQMLEVQPVATSSGSDPPTNEEIVQHPGAAALAPSVAGDHAEPRKLVRVYLVCDQRDHPLLEANRARHLRDHLLALGFEVKLPLADHDDAAQFSRDNRNKLKQCDAVLLYWGTSRQAWFDQRLGELLQARGWRQGREFTALGAYLADPGSPVKQNYETRELDELIKQFDAFDLSDTRLVRFVTRLGSHS
jgi:hypothetical protein